MNREQMVAPFAEEELRQFEGRGGKTMTYIEDETVMDRLDAGYGYGNWQVQVDAVSDSVVKVRLGVRESSEWTWFEDFGYPNRDGGESLKEAVSDGIRRCGRYVGIARDLYRKSTYEPGGALAARPARGAKPATVNSGPPPEHPPLIPPNVETETLIGTPPRQTGTVRRLAQRTPLEGREGPDGHAIVFKLEIGPEKEIAQVVVKGDAGEKLWLACSMKPDTLVGHSISVKGRLYNVTQPNRPSKYRLHVMEWSTDDYEYPAPPTGPEPPDDVSLVGEHEAPTAPLFDDVAVAS